MTEIRKPLTLRKPLRADIVLQLEARYGYNGDYYTQTSSYHFGVVKHKKSFNPDMLANVS
jgi:hypothetical protein